MNDIWKSFSYDSVQDTLYILFEPVNEPTFYDDVAGRPGVMLRYTVKDKHFVGITVEDVSQYLGKTKASVAEAFGLVHTLIQELQPLLSN